MLCGQNQGLYTDTKRIWKIENAFKECSCTSATIEKCKALPQLHISRWASLLNAIQLKTRKSASLLKKFWKKLIRSKIKLICWSYLHHRGLCCTWTCQDNRSMCYSCACVYIKGSRAAPGGVYIKRAWSEPGRVWTTGAFAASELVYTIRVFAEPGYLDCRSLYCSRTCLHHRSLSCTWKRQHYIGLSSTGTCLHYRGQYGDVSTPQGLRCTWTLVSIMKKINIKHFEC